MKWLSFLLVAFLFLSCDRNPVNNDDNYGTMTDIDGNVYKTVKIGNQVWMAENLRVTRYNDGTAIPHVPDSAQWVNLTTPGYCYYNNTTHPDEMRKWGALFNWYVVAPTNQKQVAPAGWRVPTDADWDTLENYLITNGYNSDGTTTGNKIAKSMAAGTDWESSSNNGAIGNDLQINNTSGFSALPGGYRSLAGIFRYLNYGGSWWSATADDASTAFARHLYSHYETLNRHYDTKQDGFSVRLLLDRALPE